MVEGFDKGHSVEMLDKTEHVTLGIGQRIEPAPALRESR